MPIQFKKIFSKKEPCPSCGKDGCKLTQDGLLLCRSNDSQADAPEGYRYIKQDQKDGLWGIFAPLTDEIKPFQPEVIQIQPDQFLTLAERGQAHEQLIQQLPSSLYPNHVAWLKNRGYDDGFIEFMMTQGMRSYDAKRVGPLQDLSPMLPGVDLKNPTQLRCRGLLLPMPSWDGQILGFQYIPEERIKADSSGRRYDKPNKYTWLSSGSEVGTLTLPAPYNSNPHGFFMPPVIQDAQTLGLTEGTLKGAFTAYKLGHPVLATASGGAFNIEQLDAVIKKYGFNRLILYPDAGMLDNKNISTAYFNLYQSVKELGLELLVAWWEQYTKDVGDIDDLILKQASDSIELIPYMAYFKLQEQDIQKKLTTQNTKSLMPREGGTVHKHPSVEDIDAERLILRSEIDRLLRRAAKPGMTIVACPTGLGKTTTIEGVINQLFGQDELNKKLLILVHKQKDAKKLEKEISKNFIVILSLFLMLGRSKDPKSWFYCPDYNNVERSAKNRQYARCNCAKEDGTACPYLIKERDLIMLLTKTEPCVVVSTYASFINDGDKLSLFDKVIVDESIFDANLVEYVTVTPQDVTALYKCLANVEIEENYPEEHPLWPFLDAVKQIIFRSMSLTDPHDIQDFRPLWQSAYQGSDADLELLISGETDPANPKYQSLKIESNNQVKRFIVDLVQAIRNPIASIFVSEKGIEFARARNALNHLRNMEVINLDATPNKPLLEEVFDSVEYFGEGYSLSNVDIIQVPGRVYTRSVLNLNADRRREIESIIHLFIERYGIKEPFAVVPKPLYGGNDADPDSDKSAYININHPNVKMAYFGGETKGSNLFKDCDAAFIIGHHQEPVHITELRVNALRRSMPIKGQTIKIMRQMELVGDTKMVPARLQYCHPDPLIQHCIEHDISSHIIQAIGRLRAISRPGQNLKVFIINGTLLTGIPIDEVIYVDDLLQELGLKSPRQKNDILVKFENEQRLEILGTLCREVINDSTIGRNKLSKKVGLSPNTVSKYWQSIKNAFNREWEVIPHESEFYVLLGTREPYHVQERILMNWLQFNLCWQYGLIDFDRFIGWQNIPMDQSA